MITFTITTASTKSAIVNFTISGFRFIKREIICISILARKYFLTDPYRCKVSWDRQFVLNMIFQNIISILTVFPLCHSLLNLVLLVLVLVLGPSSAKLAILGGFDPDFAELGVAEDLAAAADFRVDVLADFLAVDASAAEVFLAAGVLKMFGGGDGSPVSS